MPRKTIIPRVALLAAGALFFAAGQFLILSENKFLAGGMAAGTGLLFIALSFITPFLNFILDAAEFFFDVKKKASRKFRELKAEEKRSEKSHEAEKKNSRAASGPRQSAGKPLFDVPQFNYSFKIRIPLPKTAVIIAAIVCFVAAAACLSVFLISPATSAFMKLAVFLLLLGAGAFVKFLIMKSDEMIDYDMDFGNSLKMLLAAGGAIAILIGWILLINQHQAVQNIGVVFTTIGVISCFLSLPQNKDAGFELQENSDILLKEIKILDNPFVKGGLIVLFIVLMVAGLKIMDNPSSGMLSMAFYAAAILVLFILLPVINFREHFYDNRWFNILKLAAILIALVIAYKAQVDMTQRKLGEAVLLYLIAGLIFVVTFPVYSKKEEATEYPLVLELVFLGVLMAIGLYLRVNELNIRPFGLENDESGGMVSELQNFWVGQHPIYAYVAKLSYLIFDYTRLGLRAQGVMMGMIAIPAMYFAVRAIINQRAAMFVAVVFTFLRWNLHYSRSGHGTILMIVAESLAVFFIIKALQKRDNFTLFMAGLTTGLCWYGLLTGWFVILVPTAYFIVQALTSKQYLKRNVIGIIAFMLGFWIFSSQHIHNFFISKQTYFKRIGEVSVFSKDGMERQNNPAKAIVDNTQRVLLMFNYEGDNRQRNSGGAPYEPGLDFVTSMFFAIGFIYAMYYTRYYIYFVLVMLFFSQAAGSVFAIEAPSAMRAIGTMIPAMIFVGLAFDRIWLAFRRVFGKKLEVIYLPLLLIIPLFFIIKANYDQYFGRWVTGLDELSTAAGMYSEKIENDKRAELGIKEKLKPYKKGETFYYRVFLYTGLYPPAHPPFRVYRWDNKVNSSNNLLDGIKNLALIDFEDYAVYLHYDTWDTREFWKTLFPGTKFDIYEHEIFGDQRKKKGTAIETVLIPNEEIKAKRGVSGIYTYPGGKTETVQNDLPQFSTLNARSAPYSVSWKGTLLVYEYGEVVFENKGSARAAITIDGRRVETGNNFMLAKGLHRIAITAARASQADTLDLYMGLARGPGGRNFDKEMIKLDERVLYQLPVNGLHSYYYSGEKPDTELIKREQIEPVIWMPGIVQDEFGSAIWKGAIKIEKAGDYKFITRLEGVKAEAMVVINGSYSSEAIRGEYLKKIASGLTKVNSFRLSPGTYKFAIYEVSSSRMLLYWKTPGMEQEEVIPSNLLTPEM